MSCTGVWDFIPAAMDRCVCLNGRPCTKQLICMYSSTPLAKSYKATGMQCLAPLKSAYKKGVLHFKMKGRLCVYAMFSNNGASLHSRCLLCNESFQQEGAWWHLERMSPRMSCYTLCSIGHSLCLKEIFTSCLQLYATPRWGRTPSFEPMILLTTLYKLNVKLWSVFQR